MERLHMKTLEIWLASPHRKPLVLDGARQVGKTWLAKEFGKTHFQKTAYISFMDNAPMKALFDGTSNPANLIAALSIEAGVAITPGNTLLVLDEVQEAPAALSSLKHFCEKAPEYAVLATGSSMGITLHSGTSFPVGKVDLQTLRPLTFCEFLLACQKPDFARIIQNGETGLMAVFHDELLRWLLYYLLVGGMPEAVAQFAAELPAVTFSRVSRTQSNIAHGYRDDFSKHQPHMPSGLTARLNQVWTSIPAQLSKENKRFLYGAVREGARGRDFELAIQWLCDTSLAHKVTKVNPPVYPLGIAENFDLFKLFLSDVGILGNMMGISPKNSLEGNLLFEQAKGCLAEQYVCQQLVAIGLKPHYWQASNSSAELDFVVQMENEAVPIEVKSGINLQAKSLKAAVNRFNYRRAIRFSAAKPNVDGIICDLPLYAVESLPALFGPFE